MGFLERIISIPQAVIGLLSGFFAILFIRVTYPIVSLILGLWTSTTMMYVTATLIYWLIVTFVLYVAVYQAYITVKPEQEQGLMR